MMLESAYSEDPRLISREIIFEVFQSTYVIIVPQRHRRTDVRTDGQLAVA